MDKNDLTQQIEAMRRRVRTLYTSAGSPAQQPELLAKAFEELQTAVEELQAMQEELHRQQEHLLDAHENIEAERQSYQELFESAPVAYLITGLDATIRKANHAAAALFQNTGRFLVGRSLALFIPEGERRAFRTMVAELRLHDQPLEWHARMQPWRGAPFDAALTTRVVRGSHGQITSIRWVIQNLTARKQGEEQPRAHNLDPEQRIDEFVGQSGDRPPANNP
jgi:PAS domain S-box-containing protein